jgi:leucyl-tRNA synthetase
MAARLAAPMMPHLAEEILSRLRPGGPLVAELPWPEVDASLAAAETVTIAVQVMGKLRGTVGVPPGAAEAEVIAAAQAEPNVARALEGKRVVKRIYVPGRIVNFVIAGAG